MLHSVRSAPRWAQIRSQAGRLWGWRRFPTSRPLFTVPGALNLSFPPLGQLPGGSRTRDRLLPSVVYQMEVLPSGCGPLVCPGPVRVAVTGFGGSAGRRNGRGNAWHRGTSRDELWRNRPAILRFAPRNLLHGGPESRLKRQEWGQPVKDQQPLLRVTQPLFQHCRWEQHLRSEQNPGRTANHRPPLNQSQLVPAVHLRRRISTRPAEDPPTSPALCCSIVAVA
jgi:hypothetical protein